MVGWDKCLACASTPPKKTTAPSWCTACTRCAAFSVWSNFMNMFACLLMLCINLFFIPRYVVDIFGIFPVILLSRSLFSDRQTSSTYRFRRCWFSSLINTRYGSNSVVEKLHYPVVPIEKMNHTSYSASNTMPSACITCFRPRKLAFGIVLASPVNPWKSVGK